MMDLDLEQVRGGAVRVRGFTPWDNPWTRAWTNAAFSNPWAKAATQYWTNVYSGIMNFTPPFSTTPLIPRPFG
jgi:hypothetical protein